MFFNKIAFLIVIFLVQFLPLQAQQYKYAQVPFLTPKDFLSSAYQKPRKTTVAYTGWHVHNPITELRRISNDKYYMRFSPKVYMRKDISWLDKKLLKNKKELARVLEHERGHLLIAYIVANALEKKMTGYYSKYYKNEASALAGSIFSEFRVFERNYDIETRYSNDYEKQREWNKKLRDLLN